SMWSGLSRSFRWSIGEWSRHRNRHCLERLRSNGSSHCRRRLMTEESKPPQDQLPFDRIPDTERSAAICALLFVSSSPVSLDTIARHLGCRPDEAAAALAELEAQLGRLGLALQRCDEQQVQLITAPRFAQVVQRFLGL